MSEKPEAFHCHFKTDELKDRCAPICRQVLQHFTLPSYRLLCWFDDADHQYLVERWGPFRGAATPVIGSGSWPDYVDDMLFDATEIAFDFIIYLPGRTCSAEEPLIAVTFAHELQHFLHWGNNRKIWKANSILYDKLETFEPTRAWNAWDVPAERECMIVSKRVVEKIVGPEPLRSFVDFRIVAGQDFEEWKFFRALDVSADFNLLEETKRFVSTFRHHLLRVSQEGEGSAKIDFSQPDWWS